MSQENVEVARRYIWAFVNDLDTFRELTHPEIEWAPVEENHTPSHGIEGAVRIRNGWLEAWDTYRLEVEEILDAGDDVLVSGVAVARGKGSGVEVELRLYFHAKVSDGKVVYVYEYQDRAEALKAVGLQE
jgi:ketosteroid isomerase-like protein